MTHAYPPICQNFDLSKLSVFLAYIVSSIVDSCNILMYVANSVTPLYLCTQPKLVRIFIYHVFKMQSILKRATKTFFNAKYQGHYVCAYTTLNYCVESCHDYC